MMYINYVAQHLSCDYKIFGDDMKIRLQTQLTHCYTCYIHLARSLEPTGYRELIVSRTESWGLKSMQITPVYFGLPLFLFLLLTQFSD